MNYNEEKAWRQTFIVDNRQIDSFQKDILKLFPFSQTVNQWAEKVSKFITDTEQNEAKQVKQERLVFLKLSQINCQVNSFRELIKKFEQSNQYLVKIQNTSQNVVGKLDNFRNKMATSYEQLAQQEERLTQQLALFDRKIEKGTYEDHEMKENIKQNGKVSGQMQKNKNAPFVEKQFQLQKEEDDSKLAIIQKRLHQTEKQVELIERELKALGRFLGWPEEDHNDFLSIWGRLNTRNYFQIEEQLAAYFSLYTGEQIREHMNKYMKWKKLTQQKKELIVKYKNLKEDKKLQELRIMQLEDNKLKVEKEKEMMKKKEEKEQQLMKEKIHEWKAIKQREREEEIQRKMREQEERKKEDFYKRRQLVEKNKELIEEWKEKEQKKQKQSQRVQSSRKIIPDKQAEERIRAREEQLILKKIEIVSQKQKMQELQREKEEKIKEMKMIKYAHVGNKLDQKTKAMKQKEREKWNGQDKKEANTFGGQLLVGGRAIPAWMQGI